MSKSQALYCLQENERKAKREKEMAKESTKVGKKFFFLYIS